MYDHHMIYLVATVLLTAFVASMSRLATEDVITAPWRVKIREKYGDQNFWVRALECLRCTSVWVSPLPTAITLLVFAYGLDLPTVWWLILAVLWIPISKAIAYLAFVLYIRGEA